METSGEKIITNGRDLLESIAIKTVLKILNIVNFATLQKICVSITKIRTVKTIIEKTLLWYAEVVTLSCTNYTRTLP